ncbi:MAG: hypothetical protein AB7G37_21310 [Solirubrobacteraceae bacterium]
MKTDRSQATRPRLTRRPSHLGPRATAHDDPVPVLVGSLRRWAARVDSPMAGELLASAAVAWPPEPRVTADAADRRHGPRMVDALAADADGPALAALRALQLGATDPIASAAAEAARRLVAEGAPEPGWWPDVPVEPAAGPRCPVPDVAWGADALRATDARIGRAVDGDPLRLVVIEFRGRGEPVHTLAGVVAPEGVLSGLQIVGPVRTFVQALPRAPDPAAMDLRRAAVHDAAALLGRSLAATDARGDDDARAACAELRGLAQRRLATARATAGGGSALAA